MTDCEAARILGVPSDAPRPLLRARYLERLLIVHPDHNRSADATERTIELTFAYELLVNRSPRPHGRQPETPQDTPRPATSQPATSQPSAGITVDGPEEIWPGDIRVLDDDTIAVRAPGHETVLRMIEAASELGEITFCDPTLGMVQVVIEFVDAPTAQILMTTQGRGDGTTEVFCSVDPFNGGDVPATRPVVAIIADAIAVA